MLAERGIGDVPSVVKAREDNIRGYRLTASEHKGNR